MKRVGRGSLSVGIELLFEEAKIPRSAGWHSWGFLEILYYTARNGFAEELAGLF